MKLKNKAQIDAWLADGEMEKVLDELLLQLKASKTENDFLKTATTLSGQLGKLKADKMNGVITYEQETVAFNKLQAKVLSLKEAIEKGKPKPATAAPSSPPIVQRDSMPSPSPKSSNWWKWLALPLLAFGGWWVFLRDPSITAQIRVCTVVALSEDNYCNEDMTRLTVNETGQRLFVTAVFPGEGDGDPLIRGTLYNDLTGAVFPTEEIVLTMQEPAIGYMAELRPSPGIGWTSGDFRLDLSYNGKPAGEKKFTLFYDVSDMPDRLPSFESIENNQKKELLPLESIKAQQKTFLTHPDSLGLSQ